MSLLIISTSSRYLHTNDFSWLPLLATDQPFSTTISTVAYDVFIWRDDWRSTHTDFIRYGASDLVCQSATSDLAYSSVKRPVMVWQSRGYNGMARKEGMRCVSYKEHHQFFWMFMVRAKRGVATSNPFVFEDPHSLSDQSKSQPLQAVLWSTSINDNPKL